MGNLTVHLSAAQYLVSNSFSTWRFMLCAQYMSLHRIALLPQSFTHFSFLSPFHRISHQIGMEVHDSIGHNFI